MRGSRSLPAAFWRSWLAVPIVAGAAVLGVGGAAAFAPIPSQQTIASAHHQTFNVGLGLGDEVELASNGPLRYVARCVYDRSPGEDFDSGDDRFVQRNVDPVVRVGVFVTSTVDGFTSNGPDHTLPVDGERRVAGTSAIAASEQASFTFGGGNATYAESNGQTFYLGLDRRSVGLGATPYRHQNPVGCTVAGTAFTATGTAAQ